MFIDYFSFFDNFGEHLPQWTVAAVVAEQLRNPPLITKGTQLITRAAVRGKIATENKIAC